MIRTQPMSSERTADGSPSAPGPTTSSVEPPPMSATSQGPSAAVQVGGGADERQPPLLLAAEQLGAHADDCLGRREEVLPVGGVARRRGGRHAHPADAVARP